MEELITLYAKAGVSGAIVIVAIWLVVTYINKLQPRIMEIERKLDLTTETIRQNNNVIEKNLQIMNDTKSALEDSQKVIKNNTEALVNFSKSLQYFTKAITVVDTKIDMINHQFIDDEKNEKKKGVKNKQ